ncbi:hypothetical protein B296_00027190, partial [Ensete ventricosum]
GIFREGFMTGLEETGEIGTCSFGSLHLCTENCPCNTTTILLQSDVSFLLASPLSSLSLPSNQGLGKRSFNLASRSNPHTPLPP